MAENDARSAKVLRVRWASVTGVRSADVTAVQEWVEAEATEVQLDLRRKSVSGDAGEGNSR